MKTKIEQVEATNPDIKILESAARLLTRGEVIVCPTDTGYALAANALNARAVAKVFHLKGRVYSNPIHMTVSTFSEAEKYTYVTPIARFLANRYLPGALTIVLRKKENVPAMLVAGGDTVGIRVPDNAVIIRLAEITGLPLTATSANISGQPGTYSTEEVAKQLGESLAQVPMVLDQGPIKGREVSTIVDLTASPPQLIRQGRISWLEIHETLGLYHEPEKSD
jgi:L-threonylcarbamoyladenylate synthase